VKRSQEHKNKLLYNYAMHVLLKNKTTTNEMNRFYTNMNYPDKLMASEHVCFHCERELIARRSKMNIYTLRGVVTRTDIEFHCKRCDFIFRHTNLQDGVIT
jgi:uncharacterized protein with PIN domain